MKIPIYAVFLFLLVLMLSGIVASQYLKIEKLTVEINQLNDTKLSDQKKQTAISECETDAEEDYQKQWTEYCKLNEIKIEEDGSCAIPINQANEFDKGLREEKQLCISKYK